MYRKVFTNIGCSNFKTINNTEEFLETCGDLINKSDVYTIVNGMWAETIIKILLNQIKYNKKMNKKKKLQFNTKVIIFTRSYDMNKKWLKKEPKLVHSVTSNFIDLTLEFSKLFD